MRHIRRHHRVESQRGTGKQTNHLIDHDIIAGRYIPVSHQVSQGCLIDRAIWTRRLKHYQRAPTMFEITIYRIDNMRHEWPRRSGDHKDGAVVRYAGLSHKVELLNLIVFAFEGLSKFGEAVGI